VVGDDEDDGGGDTAWTELRKKNKPKTKTKNPTTQQTNPKPASAHPRQITGGLFQRMRKQASREGKKKSLHRSVGKLNNLYPPRTRRSCTKMRRGGKKKKEKKSSDGRFLFFYSKREHRCFSVPRGFP